MRLGADSEQLLGSVKPTQKPLQTVSNGLARLQTPPVVTAHRSVVASPCKTPRRSPVSGFRFVPDLPSQFSLHGGKQAHVNTISPPQATRPCGLASMDPFQAWNVCDSSSPQASRMDFVFAEPSQIVSPKQDPPQHLKQDPPTAASKAAPVVPRLHALLASHSSVPAHVGPNAFAGVVAVAPAFAPKSNRLAWDAGERIENLLRHQDVCNQICSSMLRSTDSRDCGRFGWPQARRLGADLCTRFGLPGLSESQFRAVFHACDEDGDGQLTREEVCRLFEVYLRMSLACMDERNRLRLTPRSSCRDLEPTNTRGGSIWPKACLEEKAHWQGDRVASADDVSTQAPLTNRSCGSAQEELLIRDEVQHPVPQRLAKSMGTVRARESANRATETPRTLESSLADQAFTPAALITGFVFLTTLL